ncbi:MAG: hypothetical protein ABIS07_11525 [Dokdonella sp.]
MSDEKVSATPSTPLRAIGGVVILAGAVAAILTAMFISEPLQMKATLSLLLLTSLAVSAVGGLWLLFVTKNFWWALTFLPVIGVGAVWLLFALMAPVTLH